jgi:hypothetical protein
VFAPVEYSFPTGRKRGDAGPAFITFDDKWGSNFENRWVQLTAQEEGLAAKLVAVATKLYEAFDGQGTSNRIAQRLVVSERVRFVTASQASRVSTSASARRRGSCTCWTSTRTRPRSTRTTAPPTPSRDSPVRTL